MNTKQKRLVDKLADDIWIYCREGLDSNPLSSDTHCRWIAAIFAHLIEQYELKLQERFDFEEEQQQELAQSQKEGRKLQRELTRTEKCLQESLDHRLRGEQRAAEMWGRLYRKSS